MRSGYSPNRRRCSGTAFLVHEPLDQVAESRSAWIYNAGSRRVRRAPDLAYDGVNDGSEGMVVTDQIDGYNGAPDRYDWQLLGKREIYVPYNTYGSRTRRSSTRTSSASTRSTRISSATSCIGSGWSRRR